MQHKNCQIHVGTSLVVEDQARRVALAATARGRFEVEGEVGRRGEVPDLFEGEPANLARVGGGAERSALDDGPEVCKDVVRGRRAVRARLTRFRISASSATRNREAGSSITSRRTASSSASPISRRPPWDAPGAGVGA